MRRILAFLILLLHIGILKAQELEIRPQFGHDPLWADVSSDGKYAVTASTNSIILWDLREGNVIIERPFQSLGVQFIEGFPSYCVAADLVHDDWSLDSFYDSRSVVNLLTGEKLFEVADKYLNMDKRKLYQVSVPFDSKGRIKINDNHGNDRMVLGGKIPGGMSNVEIDPDGRYLLVGGMHPVVWNLDEMRVSHEIPLYSDYMERDSLFAAGLDILPFRKQIRKFTKKQYAIFAYRQFTKAHFADDGTIIAGTPGGEVYTYTPEGEFKSSFMTYPSEGPVYDCAVKDSLIIVSTNLGWIYTGGSNESFLKQCRPTKREGDTIQTYKVVYEILSVPNSDSFLCTTDGGNLYLGSSSHPENGLVVIALTPSEDGNGTLALAMADPNTVIVTRLGGYYSFFSLLSHEDNLFHWDGVHADLQAVCVMNDGRILLGGDLGRIGIISKGEKKVGKVLSYGFGEIRGIVEDPIRHHVYVSSSDGALRVLNDETLSLIATCYYLGNNNSIIFTPDGYYSADKSVANLVMYGRGLDLFSFDRFDLLRNRPDIIKERLGGRQEEVALLKRAYEKRLRRMGFSDALLKESAQLPEVAITRFPTSEEVKVDKVTLGVQFKDKSYPIVKVLAWLNGSPLFGREGLLVEGNLVEKDIEVLLASGKNIIEVSCINSIGVESLRESRTITYVNSAPRKELFVVAVGVSHYQHPGHNLQYAAKDAEDMAGLFSQCGAGLYDGIHELCITDSEVDGTTTGRISEFVSRAGRDDVVIAFYAGHGLISKDYDYYLSTYSTDFSHPEESAISFEDFEGVFDGIESLNKLILIDACHSGEIDKEDVQTVMSEETKRGKILFRGTGLGQESLESQVMKSQFNDIRRGSGATVFAGSSGLEVAVEGEEWKNGLFTWALRKGVEEGTADSNKDGFITVSEMMRFGETEVFKLSEGRQTPGARIINAVCDFVIRRQEQ